MNLKAEWVMMIASQVAVAARDKNLARLSLLKLVSSATRMLADG